MLPVFTISFYGQALTVNGDIKCNNKSDEQTKGREIWAELRFVSLPKGHEGILNWPNGIHIQPDNKDDSRCCQKIIDAPKARIESWPSITHFKQCCFLN